MRDEPWERAREGITVSTYTSNIFLVFLPQEQKSMPDFLARIFNGDRKHTDFQIPALSCGGGSQNKDIDLTLYF